MNIFSINRYLLLFPGKNISFLINKKGLGRLLLLLTLFFFASSFERHHPEKPTAAKKNADFGPYFSGGDFSLDFAAAGPETYTHDGSGNPQPFFADKVESLEGGDFKCGDVVTYFTKISVDAGASVTQTISLDYSFLADATGQSGVGHDHIVSVGINSGDPAMVEKVGGTASTATLSNESLNGLFEKGTLTGTVTIDGLDAGETIIVFINVRLACKDGAMPTGNLQGAITSGRVTDPVTDNATINVGNQTVPFKQIGQIVFAGCALPAAGPFCEGSKNTHVATALVDGATYIWDLSGNATFEDGSKMKTITAATDEYTSSVNVIAGTPGSYTLSVTISKSNAQTQSCSVDVTVNAKTVPTFNPISAICNGDLLSLPLKSLENITGTWSPAFDNTQTTLYTFTPDDGQCAATAKLTVTVNQKTTPTFNTVGPLCAGSTPPTLSAKSLENITGTWSPATISTASAGTITYTFTPDAGQCATGTTLKVTVNSLPTATISGNVSVCKSATTPSTVNLSVILTGTKPWSIAYSDGTNSTTINNIQSSPYTLAVSTGSTATYTITSVTDANCTNTGSGIAVVNVNPCVVTFTQGFWGGTTANGKDCKGQTVNTILNTLLSSSPYVGVTGKNLTLNNTTKLIGLLPGGGYVKNVFDAAYTLNPYTLPAGYLDSKSKKLNSVVISQTIALKLNVLYNAALGNVAFVAGKNILNTAPLVYATNSCTVSAISTTTSQYTMSAKVLCYLFTHTGAYTTDINGLLKLANDVVGGALNISTANPFSYSDLVQTLDAVNRGFDRGAMLKGYTGTYSCGVTSVTNRAVTPAVVGEIPTSLSVTTYPNPYNTTVRFVVNNPKAGQGSLDVFNMLGQKVNTVYRGFIPAGTQTYNLNVSSLHQANLVYRLSVGNTQVTGKLLHVKE